MKKYRLILIPAFSILSMIIVIFVALKIWFFEETKGKHLENWNDILFPTMAAMAIATTVGLIPAIKNFLNSDIESDTPIEKKKSFQELEESIDSIKSQLKKFKNSNNNSEIKEKIDKYVEENITATEIGDVVYNRAVANLENRLVNKLTEQFKHLSEKDLLNEKVKSILAPLESNTEKYIARLQRNSIVNLIIGIIGTMLAITFLSFTLLTKAEFPDFLKFSMHFLPRFLFVASIQIFAFFFLRLYKNNLEDAKYFQNELTNISCKIAALKVAFLLEKPDMVTDILGKLSIVERNFKLAKDETLLDIEKARIEKDFDLEMLASYKEFLRFFKKENSGQN